VVTFICDIRASGVDIVLLNSPKPANSPRFSPPKISQGTRPMAQAFILHDQQFQRMKSVIGRLCVECAARAVFLVDRDGQTIAVHGEIGDMDMTSFASLAAGNVAATHSMAKLIGENTFPSVVHEGERESIFISVIGRSLLVVVFDERSTLGLVKIRAKKASYEVASILDDAANDSKAFSIAQDSVFADISDDDIDSLFA
jgi:predicted regulator of Ras-like GTPase activity (Roadblock/LC7/MglB family)